MSPVYISGDGTRRAGCVLRPASSSLLRSSTAGHITKFLSLGMCPERICQVGTARAAIATDRAPAALGPYSQAIVAGGFVFCSGTSGIDPATGVAADDITEQTEQALRNVAAVLEAAGASMADLVKTTIFYRSVDDFAAINAVYVRHMPDPPPARSAPANVHLPRGLKISIEAIAVLPSAGG